MYKTTRRVRVEEAELVRRSGEGTNNNDIDGRRRDMGTIGERRVEESLGVGEVGGEERGVTVRLVERERGGRGGGGGRRGGGRSGREGGRRRRRGGGRREEEGTVT